MASEPEAERQRLVVPRGATSATSWTAGVAWWTCLHGQSQLTLRNRDLVDHRRKRVCQPLAVHPAGDERRRRRRKGTGNHGKAQLGVPRPTLESLSATASGDGCLNSLELCIARFVAGQLASGRTVLEAGRVGRDRK